ncbi:MAG: Rrf2 family transcriptional regulator [Desulfuromonadaceae bacterium]|nr:Rrf2 family transcriptional regulator [Desulfuromonadaceae bacterium]
MISKKTKYALKALGYLAEHSTGEPVLISELAKEENIPRKFLEAILVTLRKGGVLKSKIGKGGGYMLAASPANITIGRIVSILEGGFALVECLNDNVKGVCEECGDPACCGIRLVMSDVKGAIDSVLESTSLADMVEKSDAARLKKSNIMDFSI